MKHGPDLQTRIRPDSPEMDAPVNANATLRAVARFLRGHADSSYCYPCLEDQVGAAALPAILKPYPGTPYRFEKEYCAVCAHWKVCVTYLSD